MTSKENCPISESQDNSDQERIFIPAAERGRSVKALMLSVRLRNVLDTKNVNLIGELHGRTYGEFSKWRNCGRTTVLEIRELVRKLQSGGNGGDLYFQSATPVNVALLNVPLEIHELRLIELPLSVRLENTLEYLGYSSLGHLDGKDVGDLLKVKNCGRKCIIELRELIARATTGEFSVVAHGNIGLNLLEVVRSIDLGLSRLSRRNRTIFEERIFGAKGNPRTLEDVGSQFKMTRERVRQIVKGVMNKVRRGGGPKLVRALEAVARECELHICPLTPELFTHWINDGKLSRPSQFYVNALDMLESTIPAWTHRPTREGGDDPDLENIENSVENWMRQSCAHPTLAEVYVQLRKQTPFRNLQVGMFLAAMRRARKIIVDFPEPGRPKLRLRRLRILDFARAVLLDSAEPLTPEKIVERAKVRYGEACHSGSIQRRCGVNKDLRRS